MDFLFVSTENDDDGYFASADLTDAVLHHALDQLAANRQFFYLPAVSLTAMTPPSAEQAGTIVGTLTVFRGGRIQWVSAGLDGLAQDWCAPHRYVEPMTALRLLQSLRSGDIETIKRTPWIVGQVKLCPICGFDLSHLSWPRVAGVSNGGTDLPPFEVPPYEICGGCGTTFGVDWIGATYGEMRQWWIEKTCPWWASGQIPEDVAANPLALEAVERLSRNLLRTPTDLPLSSAPPRA